MAEEKLEATGLQDQTERAKGHLWEKSWDPAPLGISQTPPALPAPLPHLGHPPKPPLTLPGVHPQRPEDKRGVDKIASLEVQAERELSLFCVHTATQRTSNECTSCALASKIVLVLLVLFLHLVPADN